jgi:hypothetical protein
MRVTSISKRFHSKDLRVRIAQDLTPVVRDLGCDRRSFAAAF